MKYLSPLRIIQIAIADAIQCGFALEIEPDHIQIEIGYPKYDAHYSSSISLAIAHRQNAEPLAIAQEIAQICSQNLNISTQCQIEAVGKGWLNIKLNDQYLVKSLLNLDQLPIEGIEYDHGFWQKPTLSIFSAEQILEPTIEYAYARCCALMRLAYRDDPKFSQGLFTFQEYIEPTEISLLIENLAIAAHLENHNYDNNHKSRTKLGRSLAVCFLNFYDHCRILGTTQAIAVRRIFLIRVTQKLLLAIAPSNLNYPIYL